MHIPWIKITGALLLAGIVVAIVIPNFVKAKTRSNYPHCVANLKQIDGAIQQWALENKKEDHDAVDPKGAIQYLMGGILPKCPQGGSYRLGPSVIDAPTCTKASTLGHSLSR